MNTDPTILLVDDEPDILDLLSVALIQMGLHPIKAASVKEAKQLLLSKQKFALCLSDLRLPDGEGLELLEVIHANQLDIPLAVITAHGSQNSAVEAMKRGAFDYLNKPIGLDQLRSLIKSVVQPKATAPLHTHHSEQGLIGHTAPMQQVKDYIKRFAASHAPVHIHGESGSGKERAARLIHASSRRANAPFIAVNCGAIPEALMESEFFGHRKGAFTGADRDHIGFFQAAQGGTLFLDEIAELPILMQVKLLRAIQEKLIRRVGSTEESPVDVRILSATHRPLLQWVAEGKFRQDLYYRINVIELKLPPLRELKEDILLIAEATLKRLSTEHGIDHPIQFSETAKQALLSYTFPGNVRELENMIERALALRHNLHEVTHEDLGFSNHCDKTPLVDATHITTALSQESTLELITSMGSLEKYLDEVERIALQAALDSTDGNRTLAAQRLGISFRSMRYRLDRLNLDGSATSGDTPL